MLTARVSETFGPTIQGEGPNAGRLSYFVRLGGCNLDCTWCDTPYTWDWTGKNGTRYIAAEQLTKRDPDSIIRNAIATHAANLVLTGGEPLVQRAICADLAIRWFDAGGITVEIETNGTRPPLHNNGDDVHYNVSLKLPGSGVTEESAIKPDIIRQLNDEPSVAWKFVITDDNDLETVRKLALNHRLDPWRIWIMPEGRTREAIITRGAWLADEAIERGYNYCTRLHVLAWGDQRGR